MINIYQKIQKVETLQRRVDMEVFRFKTRACIDCQKHCSECCKYSEIHATILEFLPFAYHAFKLGLLEQWYEEISRHQSQLCFFRNENKDGWGCRIYPVRGLICRLFGFSATFSKSGDNRFAACKTLKRSQPEKIEQLCEFVTKGGKIPAIASYYRKLAAIDMRLGQELLPINEALKKALETVSLHVSYRQSF